MVLKHVRELPSDGLRHPLDFWGFILSALCMACLVSGFETLGNAGASPGLSILLMALGLLAGWAYTMHARKHAEPILNLSLLKIQTFRTALLAGNLCRFSIGATPYLLALLLQVGFGMSALAAGLITFAGAVGSLAMKMAAPRILNRWGYRRVLTLNAIFTGLSLMICASFTQETPGLLMMAILLLGGFFRSLQFTAVNTLAYADISQTDMSRASSFSAMGQQLGISLGVGVAAETVSICMSLRGAQTIIPQDVLIGFLVIGTLCSLASISFWRLSPTAGASLRNKA